MVLKLNPIVYLTVYTCTLCFGNCIQQHEVELPTSQHWKQISSENLTYNTFNTDQRKNLEKPDRKQTANIAEMQLLPSGLISDCHDNLGHLGEEDGVAGCSLPTKTGESISQDIFLTDLWVGGEKQQLNVLRHSKRTRMYV